MFTEHPTAARVVIAAMLQDEFNAMEALGTLSADDFREDTHKLIVQGIERALLSTEPYDTKLVTEAMTQVAREDKRRSSFTVPPLLLETIVTEDTSRWRGYVETVKRMAVYRNVIEFSEWVQNEVSGFSNMDELYPEMVERVETLYSGKVGGLVTMGNEIDTYYAGVLSQRMEAARIGATKVFDWPWLSWNKRIKPLRPGLAGIIAAPDGQGKSSALEQIAEYWAESWKVVFVHCENDLDYTLDRRTARHTAIDIDVIESGHYTDGQQRVLSEMNLPFAPNLHYLNGAGKTADEIISEASALAARGQCDALVVDYLNKIRPSRGQSKMFAGRPYEVTGDNMEKLKTFGVKAKVPVLTAAQMVKSAQENAQLGDRLTRDKVRGSGEISEKVQLFMTLSRPVLDNDMMVGGTVIARAGEHSPTAMWRADKQNRGGAVDFTQQFLGRLFAFKDVSGV